MRCSRNLSQGVHVERAEMGPGGNGRQAQLQCLRDALLSDIMSIIIVERSTTLKMKSF